MMFLVFFQMLPFILRMQKIKSHSIYIWKFIWNEILFLHWAHFWLWNNFFYNLFFFLTFTLAYKKLFCHKYIHTAYYITSEHLSEYIKNTHGYRYHAKVQQNTCFSQLENIFKSYVLEIQSYSMWVNIISVWYHLREQWIFNAKICLIFHPFWPISKDLEGQKVLT